MQSALVRWCTIEPKGNVHDFARCSTLSLCVLLRLSLAAHLRKSASSPRPRSHRGGNLWNATPSLKLYPRPVRGMRSQPNAATRRSAIQAAGCFLPIFAGSTACVLAPGVRSFFRLHRPVSIKSASHLIFADVRLVRSASPRPLRSLEDQYSHCYPAFTDY